MSLPIIAVTGIVVGFLFLVVGFFMEDAEPNARSVTHDHDKGLRHKRIGSPKRKLA